MYRTLFYRLSRGKQNTCFKALIEPPQDHDYHVQFFEELSEMGFTCELLPVTLEGKVYDFCYHNTLEDAQKFIETLGYKINPLNPNEGNWATKLFKVK